MFEPAAVVVTPELVGAVELPVAAVVGAAELPDVAVVAVALVGGALVVLVELLLLHAAAVSEKTRTPAMASVRFLELFTLRISLKWIGERGAL